MNYFNTLVVTLSLTTAVFADKQAELCIKQLQLEGINQLPDGKFDNELKGLLNVKCRPGQAVTAVTSEYDPGSSDRVFRVGCSNVPGLDQDNQAGLCFWSPASAFLAQTEYHCPATYHLRGIHSKTKEFRGIWDRSWSFQCCQNSKIIMSNCDTKEPAGQFKGFFKFEADLNAGFVVTGVRTVPSQVDSKHVDRSYAFTVCQAMEATVVVHSESTRQNAEKYAKSADTNYDDFKI